MKFLTLYSLLILLLFSQNALAQERNEKSKTLAELRAMSGGALEPYDKFDPHAGRIVFSFTIKAIPVAVVASTLTVNDPLVVGNVITGTRQNDQPAGTPTTYDLKFDLSSEGSDMQDKVLKELQVMEGATVLAKVNIAPTQTVPRNICGSQTNFQFEAQKFIGPKIQKMNLKKKDGLLVDKYGEVIHLFIDQYGKFYGRGIPTVATPDYRFQLHLITSNCDAGNFNFNFSYTGTYEEEFNINNTFETKASPSLAPQNSSISFIVIDYPEIGPFTSTLNLKLDRESISGPTNGTKGLLDAKISIAKKYHVTISGGMFATSLKNPVDIEKFQLPGGSDSTLIASDNINSRGMLTIMATFYPRGRSFLLPLTGPLLSANRFGIIVGTQVGSKFKENFFGGIAFDVARGLSVAGGVHYGRRNFIPGYRHFDYGKDVFTGPLVIKQQWVAGLFLGVVVDARVLGYLFPGLSNK